MNNEMNLIFASIFERQNLGKWQSEIIIKIIRGFDGFRFSDNIRRPDIGQYYEPAIVWIKDDRIVHYLLFVYMDNRDKFFKSFLRECQHQGAKVMPSPESLVGEMSVIFTWEYDSNE